MTPAFMANAKTLGVIIYQWNATLNSGAGCWSSDGATCGPEYIANIGTFM